MSTNKNTVKDKKLTDKKILSNKDSFFNGKSWLNHKSGGGIIDYLLLGGAQKVN